jgi:hypothetical protein
VEKDESFEVEAEEEEAEEEKDVGEKEEKKEEEKGFEVEAEELEHGNRKRATLVERRKCRKVTTKRLWHGSVAEADCMCLECV